MWRKGAQSEADLTSTEKPKSDRGGGRSERLVRERRGGGD